MICVGYLGRGPCISCFIAVHLSVGLGLSYAFGKASAKTECLHFHSVPFDSGRVGSVRFDFMVRFGLIQLNLGALSRKDMSAGDGHDKNRPFQAVSQDIKKHVASQRREKLRVKKRLRW